MMTPTLCAAISFLAAFLSALWLHPQIVKVARLKGITDNPDKRKLQREPVPVLGGVVVFFGIVIGTGILCSQCTQQNVMLIFTLMLLMLYTGTMDDIFGLTPAIRFAIEIIAAAAAIFIGGMCIDDFHGLWNIHLIPAWCGVPLTIVTVVGIINAINLIDGVNGLSSGYCIMSCAIFAFFFSVTGDSIMLIMAAAAIGALIPFFIHNVFGNRLRMFIGDGGTLMMGMLLSVFVLRVLGSGNTLAEGLYAQTLAQGRYFGAIPFTLAVMAIPVFDTLRVMTARMLRGTSPFNPDKTHLHHAFIGLGFSHLQTTLSILGMNIAIVAGWYTIYAAGGSVNLQLYFVIPVAMLFTTGIYASSKRISNSVQK